MSDSDSEHSDAGLGGPIRSAPTEPYIPPGAAPVTATAFNPFAALGLDPATATVADIRPAFFRAIRHRHEATIARFPATAGLFPSHVQVNEAHDYLRAPGSLATARRRWMSTHRAVFFPRLGLGEKGVFGAPAAAAATAGPPSASATPGTRRTAAAAAATPNTGSSYRPSPSSSGGFFSGGSSGPRNATNSAAFTGSSPNNPFTISSSDDDDDDDDDDTANASPTPTNRRTRPSAANAAAAAAATATASGQAGAAVSSAGGSNNTSVRAAGAGASARRPPARSSNRSGGSSIRNSPILNPVTNERIIVGEWANATAATPNAVVAGFDARGRIFYRVTNEDINGNTVAAPTATATRFEHINFRAAYQNMTAGQVRIAIDQHLYMRLGAH